MRLVNEESGAGAMLSHSFLPNVLLRASTFHLIRTLPRFRLLSAHPVETGSHNVDATGRLSADTGHSIRRAVRSWLTLRGHCPTWCPTLKGFLITKVVFGCLNPVPGRWVSPSEGSGLHPPGRHLDV